ncbi:MAG: hypothetical protein KGI57_04970, partial [Hyphomicrobiales bacterium]|nr:hypothetical protein [Hyphomicrobiales bacterium]
MNRGRPVHAAALVALLSSAGTARAAVGGPFGVGLPDGGPPPLAGPLGRLFGTLVLWQAALTRALTAAVEAARHDPRALGALV